jgi:hypothetical protein
MATDSQQIPLVLGGAATVAERRETPEVFERNINVKVIRRGKERVQVLASFLDLDHSFDAEMIVEVASGCIEHAKAHMAKRPFQNLCLRALENIPKLEGEVRPALLALLHLGIRPLMLLMLSCEMKLQE